MSATVLGTGKISFHEFAQTFLQKKTQAPTLERIKEVYMINDRDKDGFLDRDECFFALKQLGHVLDERGLQRVTRLMDKNGDGRISFQGRSNFPGNIYLFKANNLNTREWCKIYSKLTIKTPGRPGLLPFYSVFIVAFKQVNVRWIYNGVKPHYLLKFKYETYSKSETKTPDWCFYR